MDFGMGAGHNLVTQTDFSRVNGIKDKNQRHDFGDAGRTSPLIRILFINGLPGRSLHQNRAGSLHLHGQTRPSPRLLRPGSFPPVFSHY